MSKAEQEVTKEFAAADAKKAFYAFHEQHAASPFADMCVDIQNARDSDYSETTAEFWQIALDSAQTSFRERQEEAASVSGKC